MRAHVSAELDEQRLSRMVKGEVDIRIYDKKNIPLRSRMTGLEKGKT